MKQFGIIIAVTISFSATVAVAKSKKRCDRKVERKAILAAKALNPGLSKYISKKNLVKDKSDYKPAGSSLAHPWATYTFVLDNVIEEGISSKTSSKIKCHLYMDKNDNCVIVDQEHAKESAKKRRKEIYLKLLVTRGMMFTNCETLKTEELEYREGSVQPVTPIHNQPSRSRGSATI